MKSTTTLHKHIPSNSPKVTPEIPQVSLCFGLIYLEEIIAYFTNFQRELLKNELILTSYFHTMKTETSLKLVYL